MEELEDIVRCLMVEVSVILFFPQLINTTVAQQFWSYDDPNYLSLTTVIDDAGNVNRSTSEIIPIMTDADKYGPWYGAANGTDTSAWSPSFVNIFYDDIMWITFSSAVRDPTTNAFLGYYAIDATTASISLFLQQRAKQFKTSTIAIVEKSTGYLIAVSDTKVKVFIVEESGVATRLDGRQSGNSRLSKMISFARDKYGDDFEKLDETEVTLDSFTLNNEKNFLNIAHVSDEYGINWVVIEALAYNEYYSQFYSSIIVMCCTCVALLVACCLVSVIASRLLMAPLMKLVFQAVSVEHMKLEQAEASLENSFSVFSEFRTLEGAFYSMVKRLKQFRSFIPDHILAVIEQENDHTTEPLASENKVTPVVDLNSDASSVSDDTRRVQRSSSLSSMSQTSSHTNHFSLGLSSNTVTMLTIHFANHKDLMLNYEFNDVTKVYKEVVSVLQNTARTSWGQIVSTNHKKMIIVFNASISTEHHVLKACRVARSLVDRLDKLQVTLSKQGLPKINVNIAISTGPSIFGNLGSDQMRFFSAMGPVLESCESVAILNSRWKVNIICTSTVIESVRAKFTYRPLQKSSELGDVTVYELGSVIQSNEEEWMYEMQEKEKQHLWDEYKQAYELFEKEEYAEAYNILQSYIELHPDEHVAPLLLQDIHKKQMEA
jgi:class 3 adenylate cyclase